MTTRTLLATAATLSLAACAAPRAARDFPTTAPDSQRLQAWQTEFALAETAHKKGDLDNALTHYNNALAALPEFWATYNNLGLVYLQQRRFGDAAAAFRAAADRSGSLATPLVNLGIARYRAGFTAQAHQAFLEALQRDPASLPALRGALTTGRILKVAAEDDLKRVQTGLLMESDPDWHDRFLEEKTRIEAALADDLKAELGIPH